MEKTIKQIADELGIDKQRVYRYIKKNHINEAHQKNGVMYYNEAVESSIKQAFSQKEPHQASASSDTVIDVLVKQSEMLKKELEIKNEELREKDRQIAEKDRQLNAVHEMLVTNQKLLDQQQQLTALQEKKLQLFDQKNMEQEKRHWWQFRHNKSLKNKNDTEDKQI